jgi:isopentenyl-diphosphate delta-isomerase
MNLRKTVEELDKKYHDRKVVLVDEQDNELGIGGLVVAHRDPGLKHRAFSLQLYRKVNERTELLLQQRAGTKPVFPRYWANTCCYNMAPGEEYIDRATTRVDEELGVKVLPSALRIIYKFSYYAPDIEGWCENEMDIVIVGECPPSSLTSEGYEDFVKLNPEEAMSYKWIEFEELRREIKKNPEIYVPWFKMIVSDSRFVHVLGE